MTRPLARLALALALTLAHVRSQPDRCFSRQHQNATVNARAALAGAGVVTEPRSVPTEQACVLACCSRLVPPGAKCNVAVFNGNKRKGGEDNCFLYHCPNERDCPLTKAPPGVRTYDIFKGAVHPSTGRPAATTTVTGQPVAAATAAPGPSAGTPVPPSATSTATFGRADEMPTKQSKTKSHKKTISEEAGPRTADKLPKSTAPPTTTPTAGTPPPPTASPPTTTTTATPPSATSSPPPPTPTTTTPPPPSTVTPPTATATTPPPRTAIPPTPPTTTTKASARPRPTATTPPSSCLTTPTPLTFGSGRSQTSEVPAGAQNPRVPVSAGPGALKSGVVALLVAAAAALMLALAVGGRKAMESFDRRHYTRLELNDLHYDL